MSKISKVRQGKLTLWYGIEQGTQEWLDLRANRATCSNAFALCVHGKEYSKNVNLQHADRSSPNENKYAIRGHLLEAEIKERLVAELCNENSRFELLDCSFITHDDYPDAGYSPDGILVDKETGELYAPIEIKCFNDITEQESKDVKGLKTFKKPDKHKKSCEKLRGVPFKYRMQCQMEMLMTDTHLLLLVLYNPDAAPGVPVVQIHQVEREEIYCNKIKEGLLKNVKNSNRGTTSSNQVGICFS